MTQDARDTLLSRAASGITVAAAKKPDAPAPYTLTEQYIITELTKCQDHLGLSDKKFTGNYLKTYVESTWSRLKNNTYGAQDRSKTFTELTAALATIRRRIARQLASGDGGKYHELPQFAAMFKAVDECLTKRGENRLIVHVAPTGGGKSRFVAELDRRHPVTSLRANESWRGSYFAALSDVVRALREPAPIVSTAMEARREMLASMKDRVEVVAIDEGNYLGPGSINMVKDLLNDTAWTVILSMTNTAWLRTQRHAHEFGQLQRRVHTVFEREPAYVMDSDDVQRWMVDAGLNGDSKAAAIELAREANSFGAFDLVARVVDRLAETCTQGHPSIDDVRASIAHVKALMGRGKK
jgi:hypothetical protein